MQPISLRGARQHNLRSVNLDLPRGLLVAVTGVSGSGKSSLAIDTLCREGQRRFLASLAPFARQRTASLPPADLDSLQHIPAAIALDQRTSSRNPRSTVGTISEVFDMLRLWMARFGSPASPAAANLLASSASSLFSFNSPQGACPSCRGLGVVDRVDPDLLVADPSRSLRQGALVPTTPSGYIVYSQVTLDVLDQVCRAHGFSVDVPWRDLTDQQRQVVFRGSTKIEVPFGKHTLESRMRWSGITAKPREVGYYRGIVTIIEQILAAKRNENALRFVRSVTCPDCHGARLRPEALDVSFSSRNIADLASLSLRDLRSWFSSVADLSPASSVLRDRILARLDVLHNLGLDYLTCDRPAPSLSGGEAQRLRLASRLGGSLQGLLYALDEPSVGLHPRDTAKLMDVLQSLTHQGNSVVVVEHDQYVIRASDWLVEVGPGAGETGGNILGSGPTRELLSDTAPAGMTESPTRRALLHPRNASRTPRPGSGPLLIRNPIARNLRGQDVTFHLGALNVVVGVSGAGKSSLVDHTLFRALDRDLHGARSVPGSHDAIEGADKIDRVLRVSQAPIGRTPRSNAATYTKLFDEVRKLFAATPEAKHHGWGASRFSFNTKHGRCEACGGSGVIPIGMLMLGTAYRTCDVCSGRRFDDDTLSVRYHGKSISDILDMSVNQALPFFDGHTKISRILQALTDIGLGYLRLGQPSTTLSGGEAQRIKLAAELGRSTKGRSLFLLDEPTTGLHPQDVARLLSVLHRLVDGGHTIIVIEHDLDVLREADWVVELGPGSGPDGGRVVFQGLPGDLALVSESPTGQMLRRHTHDESRANPPSSSRSEIQEELPGSIELDGVSEHNLQHVDVRFPKGKMTVVTGVSGSGKSSLVFDTLHAEATRRYAEGLSTYAQRFVKAVPKPHVDDVRGLAPSVAIAQAPAGRSPRSTVGTMTSTLDVLRVVFSREGVSSCPSCGGRLRYARCLDCGFTPDEPLRASHLSFHHHDGACEVCGGLGQLPTCDPERLVVNPERSLWDGALGDTKAGRLFGDPTGRYLATLAAAAAATGHDVQAPFQQLTEDARRLVLDGAGEQVFHVQWSFKRGKRAGEHEFDSTWDGLTKLVTDEYVKRVENKDAAKWEALMTSQPCKACEGTRLGPIGRTARLKDRTLPELLDLTATQLASWLQDLLKDDSLDLTQVSSRALRDLVAQLDSMTELGIGYLTLARGSDTLSAGESRRVQLVAQMASGLAGVTYVLDEPTQGLHPRDIGKLQGFMRRLLADGDNTVVVVEHDRRVIQGADHLIELGPGAGSKGGQVVFDGCVDSLLAHGSTPTAAWLQRPVSRNRPARRIDRDAMIRVRGASANNLRTIDVDFPIGAMSVVTGVSGSGKTTLVFDVLAASLRRGRPVGCDKLELPVLENDLQLVELDQRPLGSSPSSMLVTVTGLFDRLRALFASSPGAKERGLSKKHFSLTGSAGRCPVCKGVGSKKVSLDALGDIWTPCDECVGQRYRPEVLGVRLGGESIHDALQMSVEQARDTFGGDKRLAEGLELLRELGLGYVSLGQATSTLSGGERQRVMLAKQLLGRRKGESVVYLLDEPTTGLHGQDVLVLLEALDKLIEQGSTLIVVEHDEQVIASADWVVTLGPGGGPEGGSKMQGVGHHHITY